MRVDYGTIHQQRFSGAADACASHLRVHGDLDRHAYVCVLIDVHVTVSIEVADHGHSRFTLNALDESFAATWDDDVDVFRHPRQHVAHSGAICGGHDLDTRFRQTRR